MPSHRALKRNVQQWLLWSALAGLIALCTYGALANHIFAQTIWEPVGWRRFERFAAIFFGFAFTTIALRPQLLPRIVIVLAATYTVLGVGAAPFIAVCAFLFSAYVLGSAFVLRMREGTATDDLIAVVTGVGVYIFALFFLVRFPVNYPALYAGLLVLPSIAARRTTVWCAKRCLRMLREAPGVGRRNAAACALATFLLVAHLLVTLKPDVSADGLAMHLAIPADVAYRHRYTFDPAQTLWAVMPMGADWAYSFVYVLGGEYSAKLLNYAMLLIVAALLFDAVRARSGRVWAWLMTALFASTPLVQLVTGSLFVENTFAAFCLAGLAALWRFRATRSTNLLLVAAFLLGSALGIKAGAVTFVAAVAVVASIMLFLRPFAMPRRAWTAAAAIALFAAPACTPYVNAWLRTGNPLYPFLNRKFASPFLGRDESFEDQRFREPLLWRTPYDLTFHTARFSDTQDGAAGFVFVVQIPLAILILLIAKSRDWMALSALAVFLLASVLVLEWTPNLRYIYPVFPLACVALGGALAIARGWHPAFRYTLGASIVGLTAIQSCMMPSSGWYDKDFYVSRLLSQGDTVYIREHAPIRVLVAWLNSNAPNQPVLFVRDDQIAGLHGPAYSTVWHHDPFRRQLLQCQTADAVASLFERLGIRWFVAPEDMDDFGPLKEFMLKYTVRRFTVADHYVAQLRISQAKASLSLYFPNRLKPQCHLLFQFVLLYLNLRAACDDFNAAALVSVSSRWLGDFGISTKVPRETPFEFAACRYVGQAILPAAGFQPALSTPPTSQKPAGRPAAARIGCPTSGNEAALGKNLCHRATISRMLNSGIPTRFMQQETHLDALLQAQDENRRLRTTIAEMRAALELQQSEKERVAQNTARQAEQEAAHMRDTISAMREQLETLARERQRDLQQAAADAHTEIQQHIAAIRTQREEMVQMTAAHNAEIEQIRREARDERRLLEQTIAALRVQLEAQHGLS